MSTVRRFVALLAVAEAHLNEINVFPLADRDTGTNLLRTVSLLVDELDAG
ncbi:MAG: kinase, partial [Actinomycetia bacterium]|nr:kinase [Actinomycetes bacterium]